MTSKDSAGFTNGINAWNNDPYAPVYFIRYSGGNHVEMWDQNDGNDGYDGYSWRDTTSFGCNVNGTTLYIIAYAAAYLNTYYTNQSQYTCGGAVQSVAAHELGHDVGLGHDPNENQLMYVTTDRWWVDGINSPQSDDNAGVNAIYSKCCYALIETFYIQEKEDPDPSPDDLKVKLSLALVCDKKG